MSLGDFLKRFYRGCAALRAAHPHFGFNKSGTFIVRYHLNPRRGISKEKRTQSIPFFFSFFTELKIEDRFRLILPDLSKIALRERRRSHGDQQLDLLAFG